MSTERNRFMNKLVFALSLVCVHNLVFSAQEVAAPQLKEKDITPASLKKALRPPIVKSETEDYIMFFASLDKCHVRASREKRTGKKEFDSWEIIHYPIFEGHEREIGGSYGPCSSPYSRFPIATYNALQALHKKQSAEKE
jgi:hypothetical protein